VGTTIVVAVLIVVVLLFIWASTIFISRRVQQAEGRGECNFCGRPLDQIGIEYSTHCSACGRQQPWESDPDGPQP